MPNLYMTADPCLRLRACVSSGQGRSPARVAGRALTCLRTLGAMPSLNADVLALIVCLALPEDAFERVRVKRLLTVVSRDWRHIARSIGRHVAAVEADELPAFAERVSPFNVCRPLELRRLHLRVVLGYDPFTRVAVWY